MKGKDTCLLVCLACPVHGKFVLDMTRRKRVHVARLFGFALPERLFPHAPQTLFVTTSTYSLTVR